MEAYVYGGKHPGCGKEIRRLPAQITSQNAEARAEIKEDGRYRNERKCFRLDLGTVNRHR